MHGPYLKWPQPYGPCLTPACLNPWTTDYKCIRHVTLAACYQLPQSVLNLFTFVVGVVLHNQAVEDNMAMSSELSLAVLWWKKQPEASNSSNDWQFYGKVKECPLNSGYQVLFAYKWEYKECPLYKVVGCPTFRNCLSIWIEWRTVGILESSCYVVYRCLLLWVDHYTGFHSTHWDEPERAPH